MKITSTGTIWVFDPDGWTPIEGLVEGASMWKAKNGTYYIEGHTGNIEIKLRDGTEIIASTFYIEKRKET